MGQMDQILVNHGILYGSYRSCICQSWVSYAWVILVINGLYAGQIWVVRVTCGSTMGYIGHMGHVWVMMWGSPMGILIFCGSYGLTMGHVFVINGSYGS